MRKEAEWVLHAANTVSAASVQMALRIIASGNDYHIFSIFFFLQRSIDLEISMLASLSEAMMAFL